MPIGFLVPAFLAGLAAIVVPLLLHLRHRERQKPRPFPSLMFLGRIPIRTDQKRRITDWPLLLLRLLALGLLVAAFARPFLREPPRYGARSRIWKIPASGNTPGADGVRRTKANVRSALSHIDWSSATAVSDSASPP